MKKPTRRKLVLELLRKTVHNKIMFCFVLIPLSHYKKVILQKIPHFRASSFIWKKILNIMEFSQSKVQLTQNLHLF
jgi:hypothetical protein